MADPGAPGTRAAVLERRYRWLLVAYPAAYRAERGEEIVATLLDTARPGRRTPSSADVVDLFAAGVRRRLGIAWIAGFDAGLTVAAPVALALAAGISAFAWWRVEPVATDVHIGGTPLFGAFRTLGPIAYATWLLAAAGRALLRPAASRVLIGAAILATSVVVPLLGVVTPVDRPPLWVLMALTVFGGLAFVGTGNTAGARTRPSADERLGVASGAVAVAVTASAVTLAWPPNGGGWGYYYQPTIARVGTVVAATVAAVAVHAVIRLVRGEPAQDWLWATVLLGLPSGWLGPFDTASLRLEAESAVPHFGRLAQVLLASCVAAAAMVWLAQRRAPGAPAAPVPDRGALASAGAVALGCAAGLALFGVLAGLGLMGFSSAVPVAGRVPGYAWGTLAVLVGAGLIAWFGRGPAQGRGGRRLRTLALAAGVALAVAWLVASYDNGWTLHGWTDFGHTVALVATIAFLPLSLCAVTAARMLRGRPRVDRRAVLVLTVALGWLGYATLPFLLSWGPVLLVFAACFLVLAVAGRPGRHSARTP